MKIKEYLLEYKEYGESRTKKISESDAFVDEVKKRHA